MAELSITQLDNRVSVVGAILTRGDRSQLDDRCTLALLRRADLGAESVVLDVSHAGWFDSRALLCLVGIARKCLDVGASLVIEGASEELQEQLRLTGIDRLLGARGAELRQPDNTDATGAVA